MVTAAHPRGSVRRLPSTFTPSHRAGAGPGWAPGDESYKDTLALQTAMLEAARAAAPHAEAILATAQGRRRATRYITRNFEHIPAELLAHQLLGVPAAMRRSP
jgi:hypothetical protein